MSVKCLNCGYEMKTTQEVTTFISGLIAAAFRNMKELLSLKDLLLGGAVCGICAGPFNTMKVCCPNCGKPAHWEDM